MVLVCSIGPIQVRLVENMPVIPLFGENEPSGLVQRNPSHCSRGFMTRYHLKLAICLAKDIGFIKGPEPHLPRSFVDYPHSEVTRVPSRLLLDVGNLGGITGCVWAHFNVPLCLGS